MSLVEEYVARYKEEFNDYQKLAQACASLCESGLERNGIRSIVSHRAKRADRLRDKLEKRAENKNYQSLEDIDNDIPDLAGVRIALYFPGDKEEVDAFIRANFQVEVSKDFPATNQPENYRRRFSGYTARHYRVRLKREIPPARQRFADRLIEIQLGSVLMHAWAEVEHDLVYKPQTGSVSYDEYAILDELNGLVHAGEIALERLQIAVKRRITSEQTSFKNHYELSAFLHATVLRQRGQQSDPIIGRADVFFRFLQLTGLDSPYKLEPYTSKLDPKQTNRPVVEQIVDQILAENESLYEAYNRARLTVSESDPYGKPDENISYFAEERALGFFMRRWIAVEKVAQRLWQSALSNQDFDKIKSLQETRASVLDEKTKKQFEAIRELRNQVIYGTTFPSEQELIRAGRILEKILHRAAERQGDIEEVVGEALGRDFPQSE